MFLLIQKNCILFIYIIALQMYVFQDFCSLFFVTKSVQKQTW